MNRCTYYIEGKNPFAVAESEKYDGLRYTVCGHDAPFMVAGSSYCPEHVRYALGHTTNKAGRKL